MMRRILAFVLFASACLRPSQLHEELDQEVGRAEQDGIRIDVNGQAAVWLIERGTIELWAAAPILSISIDGIIETTRLRVHNVLPDAQLQNASGVLPRDPAVIATVGEWRIDSAQNGQALSLAAPDALDPRPHSIGVLSDVQEAIGEVGDIFERMNGDDLRYVISTGDLTRNGMRDQVLEFQAALRTLQVPFYSTVGNHEVPGVMPWHEQFGPFTTFFVHHGVAVSLVDSSNATIEPDVRPRMLAFADANAGRAHLFLTHVPFLDPSGLRGGAFRSRNEAARTLQDLASRAVDALFFGHIHSYYAYELAGVPSYVSGGGGAVPERLDGIDRHYLRVDLVPSDPDPIGSVDLVRVD